MTTTSPTSEATTGDTVEVCPFGGRGADPSALSPSRTVAGTPARTAASALPPLVSGGRPLLGHGPEFVREPLAILARGHQEHGSIFSIRFGRRRAVVLLGSAYSRFFFAETDRRLSIREAMPFFVRMFDPDFYLFAETDQYLRQRELVLPRFRGSTMHAYLEVMEAETDALLDRLGERGEFDLVDTLGPLVMRIAARAFLGTDFSDRLGDEFFAEFRRFSEGMDPVWPTWLPLPHLIRSRRARNRLRVVLGRLIQQRRRQPLDPPDFLQTLVESHFRDGEAVPDLVLVNLILLLSWAGHETTTGHISWAVADLLRHPSELDRIRHEQREVLDGGPLTMQQVHRLEHLNRALRETERLHPVAYMMVRRATEAIELDGYSIPKGAAVMVSPWLTHRMAEIYPDPERYRPDRYAENPRATRDLIGFGAGAHRCLGVHFAYLEMTVVLTRLLHRLHLELLDTDPRPVRGTKSKWPQSPCRVRYRVRQPYER
jgi:sterol 14alpha-demethylase